MTATTRPELGHIAEGDTVYVIRPSYRYARRNDRPAPTRAVVVKAARVWLTIRSDDKWATEWRMRRDTQDENDRDYPQRNARFVTAAQLAYEQTAREAVDLIHEQGIDIRLRSPWRGREIELAALLRDHTTEDAR